jgi:hypothetical protein
MPEAEFFARMGPEFAQHSDFARQNAARQADAARLLAKVEYEFHLVRRELATVMPGIDVSEPDAAAALLADTSANSALRSAKAA